MPNCRVVVVDDETSIREGLRVLIDWEQHGVSIVGEACDGSQGLAIIASLRPDIVIADVRMPRMDGLAMIREARERLGFTGEFIILSGYRDFDHAREAMRYDVREYILKPIDENALQQAVNRSRELLEVSSHKELSDESRNDEVFLSRGAVFGMFRGPELRVSLPPVLAEWKRLRVAIVATGNPRLGKIVSRERIKALLIEAAERTHSMLLFEYPAYLGILLGNHTQARAIRDYMAAVFRPIFDADPEELVMVAVGEEVVLEPGGPIGERMRDAYSSASAAMDAHIHSRNRSVYAEDLAGERENIEPLDPVALGDEVIAAFERDDDRGVEAAIDRAFRVFSESKSGPGPIEAFVEHLRLGAIRVLSLIGAEQNAGDALRDREGVPIFPARLPWVRDYLLDTMRRVGETASRLRTSESFPVRVERYLRRNYRSDLFLQGVAEEFGLNPLYFGQLFKQHFGVYFNDYLHSLRLDEGKRLLVGTDMKVFEIAEHLGYRNNEYFAQKFRKRTGMTPTQYRAEQTSSR
jgi:two-component system response regulator YesN